MNFPNLLSVSRVILIIPIILLFEINYFLTSCFIFIFASLTDFLDGYLARKFDLESSFGRFLDPVADKILIVSLIFILISNSIISGIFIYPALIIVIREILVSGLRDFFAHSRETLLVTKLSKCKTLIQMFSIGFLMVSNNFDTNLMLLIGNFGLAVASIMTIHTGYIYFKRNLRLFK